MTDMGTCYTFYDEDDNMIEQSGIEMTWGYLLSVIFI